MRDGFRAPAGYRMAAWDLSQIEMRVMAHLSGDELLIEIYHRREGEYEKHERDVHRDDGGGGVRGGSAGRDGRAADAEQEHQPSGR